MQRSPGSFRSFLIPAVALAGAVSMASPVQAQISMSPADTGLERRPYVSLGGGVDVQTRGTRTGAQQHPGAHLSVGLAYPATPRLALRAEYQGNWFLRDAVGIAPCIPGEPCESFRRVADFHSGQFLVETRTTAATERQVLAFGFAGGGLAWEAGVPRADDSPFVPVGVIGVGIGHRSALRSERGIRLEARYTVFARDALGIRGLMGVALALWI